MRSVRLSRLRWVTFKKALRNGRLNAACVRVEVVAAVAAAAAAAAANTGHKALCPVLFTYENRGRKLPRPKPIRGTRYGVRVGARGHQSSQINMIQWSARRRPSHRLSLHSASLRAKPLHGVAQVQTIM